jgi:hypothetical protein
MLKLLEAFNYSVPKIKPYKSGKLEVIFSDRYQDFVLFVDGKQQMTYNIHNHHQAYELYSQYDIAEGHCLCSGLGFLVRENWLLTKKEVTKITVIEKSKDVIKYQKLINPEIMAKLEVIEEDINTYKGKCDTFLIDHFEPSIDIPSYLKMCRSILDNITCSKMWIYKLEGIIASFRSPSKLNIYNTLRDKYKLNPLPDLNEETLNLYYLMFGGSKAITVRKKYLNE